MKTMLTTFTCAIALLLVAPGCKGGGDKKADDKAKKDDKKKDDKKKDDKPKTGPVKTATPPKTPATKPPVVATKKPSPAPTLKPGKLGTPKPPVAVAAGVVQPLAQTKLTIQVPKDAAVSKAIIAGADQIRFPGARSVMVVKPRLLTDKNLEPLEKWAAGHGLQKFQKSILKTGKGNTYTYIYEVTMGARTQAVFHQMFQIGGKDYVCFSNAENEALARKMKAACDTIKAVGAPTAPKPPAAKKGGSGFGAKAATAKKPAPPAPKKAPAPPAPKKKPASGFGGK